MRPRSRTNAYSNRLMKKIFNRRSEALARTTAPRRSQLRPFANNETQSWLTRIPTCTRSPKNFLGKELYLVVARPVRSPEIEKKLADLLSFPKIISARSDDAAPKERV